MTVSPNQIIIIIIIVLPKCGTSTSSSSSSDEVNDDDVNDDENTAEWYWYEHASLTGFGSDQESRRMEYQLSLSGASTADGFCLSSDEDDDVDDEEDTGGRQNGMAKRELNSGEQIETNNDGYDDDFEEYRWLNKTQCFE